MLRMKGPYGFRLGTMGIFGRVDFNLTAVRGMKKSVLGCMVTCSSKRS